MANTTRHPGEFTAVEGSVAHPMRLEWVKQFGVDAVSFQALKVDVPWWVDVPPPHGTGAALAYAVVGRSWIAIGTPLVEAPLRAEAVRRFCEAARAQSYRPVFFAVDDTAPFAGCRTLAIGQQPVLKPSAWDAALRRWPRLREQLRRARAKGVTVRAVAAEELAPGVLLRAEVERLRDEWLNSRAIEPLGFLVEVDPFYAAHEHLYFVADYRGRVVQFLSAVPIGSQGWLMEDVLRGRDAPNGTTELLIEALMRRLGGEPSWTTTGLTPLAGSLPWWLRVTRATTVALYDFSGLLRFRSRLHPSMWTPVWLAWDRGPAPLVLFDVVRAFADRRLLRFAWRSLTLHPGGPPWLVAVPLVVWTTLLAGLTLTRQTALLGYPLANLHAWVLFDVALAWALFTVARRPRSWSLIAVAFVALFDALLSARHIAAIGFGEDVFQVLGRTVGVAGPPLGAAALMWAAWLARRRSTG